MREFADVSVIVAAYQAAGTIGRALGSIAAQTVKPREVMVADDGSTDGTADAALAYDAAMNGIRLRVMRSETNLGAGAARNRAIAQSTQPLLAFLDADDEWLPAKLERSLAVMEEGGHVLVAHDYLTDEGGAVRRHDCRRRFLQGRDPYVQLYRKGYIPSCSVVTCREAVLAVGGFDESLRNAQDFELWLNMLKTPGARFEVFGEALLRYHRTPGGIMSHTERRLRCTRLIARRYLPALAARPGFPMLSLAYRLAAIYGEAARAGAAEGAWARAAAYVTRLLAALVAESGLALVDMRESGPGAAAAAAPASGRPGPANALLLLWVAGATIAFLAQFRSVFGRIAAAIGLGE